MRFSSYNVLSNRLPGGGYVLLNGLTGALDLINDNLHDIITNNDSVSTDEFGDEIVNEYIERGFITDQTVEEEIEYTKKLVNKIGSYSDSYNIVIVPNLNCNYRCIYCFERSCDYFKSKDDYLMTKECADAVFRFIENTKTNDKITLFGGEPLNKNNIEIIEYIVNTKNPDGKYSFGAVTNGHDLGYFMPYLGAGKIDFLQITVDGPKHIHDKRRIPLSGESSFDNIFANIKKVIQIPDLKIEIRINVDNRNIEHLKELMEFISNEGLFESDKVHIYTSKVTGLDSSDMDEQKIDTYLEKLNEQYPEFSPVTEEEQIRKNIDIALKIGMPLKRSDSYCGGLGKMLVFTPDGSIYSCWEYVGAKEGIIGRYDANGNVIWDEEVRKFFGMHRVENNQTCIKCPYVLFCLGGCFKHACDAKMDYDPRQCKIYKNSFTRIMEQAVEEHLNKL